MMRARLARVLWLSVFASGASVASAQPPSPLELRVMRHAPHVADARPTSDASRRAGMRGIDDDSFFDDLAHRPDAPIWVRWYRPDGGVVSPCGDLPVIGCHASADDWLSSAGVYRLEVTESIGVFWRVTEVHLDGTEVGLHVDLRREALRIYIDHRAPRRLELLLGEDRHDVLHNGTDAEITVATNFGVAEGALQRWDFVRSGWQTMNRAEHRQGPSTRTLKPGESVRISAPIPRSLYVPGLYRLTLGLAATYVDESPGVMVSHRTLVETSWMH